MSSALIFIFVLGVLVIIHEFGHFLAAKLVGVRVEKFSVGFGPILFGKKFGETEFIVSLLPLGGYVKLAGESPEDAQGAPWEFQSKKLWEKFTVVFAGPFMNAFLAFVLFAAVAVAGQPMLSNKIGKVLEKAPAEAAGFMAGDRVLAINGEKVVYWDDILQKIRAGKGDLLFLVEREGQPRELTVKPREEAAGQKGRKIPFVGIAPSEEVLYLKKSLFEGIREGFGRVWMLTALILHSLWLMVSGALSVKDSMTGPIGIFFMTQQAAQMGVAYLFYFMGSLSVSLFVLNLLPIPVLDGGHVLFILIEKIKGSPLKESVREKMTQVGLFLLLGLMAFVIFQDVERFSIIKNIKNFFLHH